MAKISLFLVLFFLFVFHNNIGTVDSSTVRPRQPGAKTFIEVSCRTTRYPALCMKYLARYANSSNRDEHQLARDALTISLYKARHTRSYMLKVAKELGSIKAEEYPAVRDCLQQIDDSVNQLWQSIREIRRCDPKSGISDDIFWHIDNVETWVSAALTDAINCVDEFPGHRMSKMKATIKVKVINVAQLTSNALALFHRYAARYRSAANKKP
ncbi:ARM repeat superfamily protein, D,CHO [Hibiscus syriacus]|uniref:ARM repeat superfamily protein, D,CHO n=1 Tax=Hibiscus syriacus TaxID=106335 RepID=A0A6A3A5W7_HIBSY|nr:pectinesterase inhibitor 9-like [Hibiscus syriacus]KAE8699720.1 ARM repeat superfamily protein, D,CHO [Hibiscus syriacus]